MLLLLPCPFELIREKKNLHPSTNLTHCGDVVVVIGIAQGTGTHAILFPKKERTTKNENNGSSISQYVRETLVNTP